MGLRAELEKYPASESALEAARAYFEPQLESIGLSAEKIERQTLEELEASLSNVNDAIQHPESFGSLSLSFQVSQGKLLPVLATAPEGQINIGILPILLERKSMILRRIGILRPQAQLSELKKVVVDTVEDPKARDSLLESIEISKEEAVVQAQFLQAQADQTDQERERLLLFKFKMMERKSALRRSWFERESIAGVVGALLLVSLGTAVIISMFTHTPASQIVTSSFLIVLGYFFGQAGSNQRKRGKKNKQKSDAV
jgi:uncharacterized protein Smg (DUF494 family)